MATGICTACNGTGRCPQCNGVGSFNVPAIGRNDDTRRPCRKCHCIGECQVCGGRGRPLAHAVVCAINPAPAATRR